MNINYEIAWKMRTNDSSELALVYTYERPSFINRLVYCWGVLFK